MVTAAWSPLGATRVCLVDAEFGSLAECYKNHLQVEDIIRTPIKTGELEMLQRGKTRKAVGAGLLACALIAWFSVIKGRASVLEASKTALACDGKWHIIRAVDAVTAANDYNSLNAVAVLSATEVWAVGNFHRFSDAADKTLAEHWSGTKWKLVPSPNSSSKTNILAGVAVVGSNDAYAVGYEVQSGSYQTLIEHWNGKAWTFAQNGTNKGLLTSVAATATNDVWAVGSTDYVGSGLIEHWDGKSWAETTLPEQVYFRAVAAISKNDVWAVGQQTNSTGIGDFTYTVHFDGTRWTHIPSPSPFRKHDLDQDWLTSLTALSSNDVWAGAVWRDGDYGILDHTFAEHWDGRTWQVVRSQNPGGNTKYNDFWGIAALAPDRVWAVGQSGYTNFQPLVEKWNGTAWGQVKTPPAPDGLLQGIARLPSLSAFMAAGSQYKQTYTGTLVEYACGLP
jgi:hypothetical protein